MVRGTTPTHVFKLPFKVDLVAQAQITYAQDDIVLVEKALADCKSETDTLTVTLTQEETFKFDNTKPLQIQVRILTEAGKAMASIVKKIGVQKCLSEGVIER